MQKVVNVKYVLSYDELQRLIGIPEKITSVYVSEVVGVHKVRSMSIYTEGSSEVSVCN